MGLFSSIHSRLLGRARADLDRSSQPISLGERDAFCILCFAALARIRGCLLRWRLGGSGSGLMVGKSVTVLHAKRIFVGQNVKLEANCEVHGLASSGVIFGDKVTLGRGASIRPSGYYGTDIGSGIRVGHRSAIGPYSWIGASAQVTIGDDVLLGPRVVILPENHIFDDCERTIASQGVAQAAIHIEDNCWLGADVKVLAGVTIGSGSVIAAGAIVRSDIPPNSVAAGVPARVLRNRTQPLPASVAA